MTYSVFTIVYVLAVGKLKDLNILIGMEIKLLHCILLFMFINLYWQLMVITDAYTGDDDSARLLARMYAKAHPTMHVGKPQCVQNEGIQFFM